MSLQLSREIVWQEMQKELFAVLGMVTETGEARTIGVVYILQDQKLYILTGEDTWKARHIRQNPSVSITVPIPKRIPFLPWIKIPSATISFAGRASVIEAEKVGQDVLHGLMRGQESDREKLATMCVIEIEPVGDFITYGVGIPVMTMREPEKARGRASAV
jgi:hypothetical protein